MRAFAVCVWALSAVAMAQTPHFWADGARPAPGDGPSELAGFQFGWSAQRTERACLAAEQRFVSGDPVAVCSGVARATHFEAKVRLRYCDDALCEITAVVDEADDRTYAQLLVALRRAFGAEAAARVREDDKRHYWSPGGCEASLRHRPHGHGLQVVFQSPARVLELSRTSD